MSPTRFASIAAHSCVGHFLIAGGSLARLLYAHRHRPRWMPSDDGLFLHTIVPNPGNKEQMYVGVSAGGVYRTEDSGNSCQARNNGIRVVFMPEKYPEFGHCVHKIVLRESRPERLFLQNRYTGGLATAVRDGAEVSIVPAIGSF